MPLTAVEICAAALVKVGARPIASLEEAGLEAACAKRLYPIVRDALLVAHPWSFTLAHARLDRDPGAEPWPTSAAPSRSRPTTCARSRPASAGTRAASPTASRVPGCSPTPTRDVVIAYQRRVDEAVFPALFVQPLVTRLAAELCVPVTEGTARAAELAQLAELELRRARLLDSQQATPRRIEDFTLVEARYS
jgi:hypothetical protein